jgi:zinc/manganese transport system substrate-binding protein
MKTIFCCAVFAWIALTSSAHAAINVFACEPEWGSLVKELAGERADVYVATTATQDIHRIQARPSLIARARLANLSVCTGADLEIGWMPLVRTQSGNEKIQLGASGFLEVANYVPLIEVPAVVDRAMGDVHPRGNPHLQWGPRQIQLGANEIAKRLVQIDPAGKTEYDRRLADFTARWTAATARWSELGGPLKGVGIIQHHTNYSYLIAFLGMRLLGTLEPKPGVEPTSSHLNELIQRQGSDPARLIVRSSYHSPAASEWLAERVRIPAVMLPATVGGTEESDDLFSMYDEAIRRMLAAIGSGA